MSEPRCMLHLRLSFGPVGKLPTDVTRPEDSFFTSSCLVVSWLWASKRPTLSRQPHASPQWSIISIKHFSIICNRVCHDRSQASTATFTIVSYRERA
jgi:hypothetical protein